MFHDCETCGAWLNPDYEHLHQCLSVGDRIITAYELQTQREDRLTWRMPKVPAGERGLVEKIEEFPDGNRRAWVRFDRWPDAWVHCIYELSKPTVLDKLAAI